MAPYVLPLNYSVFTSQRIWRFLETQLLTIPQFLWKFARKKLKIKLSHKQKMNFFKMILYFLIQVILCYYYLYKYAEALMQWSPKPIIIYLPILRWKMMHLKNAFQYLLKPLHQQFFIRLWRTWNLFHLSGISISTSNTEISHMYFTLDLAWEIYRSQ